MLLLVFGVVKSLMCHKIGTFSDMMEKAAGNKVGHTPDYSAYLEYVNFFLCFYLSMCLPYIPIYVTKPLIYLPSHIPIHPLTPYIAICYNLTTYPPMYPGLTACLPTRVLTYPTTWLPTYISMFTYLSKGIINYNLSHLLSTEFP